jgi:hypothetical protein
MTHNFLNAFGKEIFVEEEDYLDKATPSPHRDPLTCTFLWKPWWMPACIWVSAGIAEQLVIETLRGSVDFYYDNGKSDAKHLAQFAQPGHLARRHLRRGALYLKKRRPHRHLARHLGGLPAFQRTGAGSESNPPG